MQLFTLEDHRRVVAGEFNVTFRLWKTSHVKAGATYGTGFGGSYHIVDVKQVRSIDVSDADAWSAGQPNRAALLQLVGAHTKTKVTPAMKLWRVAFTYSDAEPEKPKLDVDEALKRVARLDAAAGKPWAQQALALIEKHPRVFARELAKETRFPRLEFKVQVRKLKRLGLTTSFKVGYELTELGQAVLDRLRARRR